MPKAVVLTKYGPPDVLVWSDVPLPEPGPGQVRIRVKAAGVSPTDLKIRRGDLEAVFPLPPDAVLGFEASGVVDALGSVGLRCQRRRRSRQPPAGSRRLRRVCARLLVDPQAAQRQLERCCRPTRVSRSRRGHLEAARDLTRRDPAHSRCGRLGRDDRHPARRLPGRQGHRRRGAAGPRSCTRPRCRPGHLRRWPRRSGAGPRPVGGRRARRGRKRRAPRRHHRRQWSCQGDDPRR